MPVMLSFLIRKQWMLVLLAAQFLAAVGLASYIYYERSSSGCINCHADKARMTRLGFPQLAVTQEQVERESKHRGVKCRECHGGDGRADAAVAAHKGMLKAMYLDHESAVMDRKTAAKEPLKPTGNDRMRLLLPKDDDFTEDGDSSRVRNILYHDRNPETLGYDPALGKRGCGASACHPAEVEQYGHSIMGANFRQRTMETWTKPYGPHNCGPSFADTPPVEAAVGDKFSFANYNEIAKNMNAPFSKGQAVDKQRICNVCHAGCLDCHFTPYKGEGAHGFTRKPPSESCSGGGRGSSICHPGTMERRRGDSYLGGDFSEPRGMTPDIHVKKEIVCVDCHLTGPRGMGDIQRKASCGDCHLEIENALAQSEHKNVSCAACHVGMVGGYQLTHWGPGRIAGKQNPFRKYSLYYGMFTPPIVMKDQTGLWIPVKAWPHSVGNIKETVKPFKGIRFRWPNGDTRDSYALLGTFDGLPENNRHLAWIEIEQVSHPYGKSRECVSCHAPDGQKARSQWTFSDEGAEDFSGSYNVTAGADGLHISGIKSGEILLEPGARLADFAPWLFLGDIWRIEHDFSIPGRGFEEARRQYGEALVRIDAAKNVMPEKRYKMLRGVAAHNTRMGIEGVGR